MSHPALGFPVSRSDAGIHTGSKTLLPSASSLQDCVPVTDRAPVSDPIAVKVADRMVRSPFTVVFRSSSRDNRG